MEIEVALIGLAGVLVGGLITWGIEWWRERQRRKGEALVAARLVSMELARAHAVIFDLKHGNTPFDKDAQKNLEGLPQWQAQSAALARELRAPWDWDALRRAVINASQRDKQAWGPDRRLEFIRNGLEALRDLAELPPQADLVIRDAEPPPAG